MKRHELEHLIRAAGAITGADEIIVWRIAELAISPEEQVAVRERWQRLKEAAARMES